MTRKPKRLEWFSGGEFTDKLEEHIRDNVEQAVVDAVKSGKISFFLENGVPSLMFAPFGDWDLETCSVTLIDTLNEVIDLYADDEDDDEDNVRPMCEALKEALLAWQHKRKKAA